MDLTFAELGSDSPYVETIWHSQSERAAPFISVAEAHFGLVVTTTGGRTTLTVRGPETRATPALSHAETEFFGILFKPGVFMPNLPPGMVLDRRDLDLPDAGSRSFWLNGSAREYPRLENVDAFLERLLSDGTLVRDPLVREVMLGNPVDMNVRTVQRRFRQATGLTRNSVFQIERARYAVGLLKQGAPILDVVAQAGYFDQPHLTRSLKHLVGLTPAQIVDLGRRESLSFLYKTTAFKDATLWAQSEEHSAERPSRLR